MDTKILTADFFDTECYRNLTLQYTNTVTFAVYSLLAHRIAHRILRHVVRPEEQIRVHARHVGVLVDGGRVLQPAKGYGRRNTIGIYSHLSMQKDNTTV